MKNIIPFKKDVIFKTNLSEITSISLEHNLNLNNHTISGEFIVSGDYKVSDKSTTVEPFELKLPFEIVIDERYNTKNALIDIDDFYYEIINNNVLSVSIDVLIDRLQENPIIELEELVDETPVRDILDVESDRKEIILDMEEEKVLEVSKEENNETNDVEEKINSLFNQFSKDSEVYVTYNVYIIRDGDSIEKIIEKYGVTEEELKKYNDLSNLQLGDKLIIPALYETN